MRHTIIAILAAATLAAAFSSPAMARPESGDPTIAVFCKIFPLACGRI